MNPSNSQRVRGAPNGAALGAGGRPVQEYRNGSNSSAMNGGPAVASMSRAEKFEDEKKRIIETCFGKKEPDGSISESYITHIRIEEDAAYPSSPPPRESPPDNKKPRVIIVAVRKSGRVRMHKARENANGTFSIGKTWVLDDLTVIESFTNAIPKTPEEQQNKQRAGPTGFIVTVQKPYYWTAHTAKEKDFFIIALIKIFKKYTGGRLPELHGFSASELEQLGGLPGGTATGIANGVQAPAQPLGPSNRVPSRDGPAIREPSKAPSESSRERRRRPSQDKPSQDRPAQPSQERQLHSAVSHPLRTTNSNDHIHLPGAFPSSDSVHDPSPHASQSQLRSDGSDSPALRPTGSQPNLKRPGPSQSTDSFRSGQESFVSGRSSNERSRSRQNGPYTAGGSNVNLSQSRFTHSERRPSTSSRNEPNPFTSQDREPVQQVAPLNFAPSSLDKSIDQPAILRSQASKNGDTREPSSSGRAPSRGGRATPSLNQSESSADHFPDETRPTTASSHDFQQSQITTREITAPTAPSNEEDLSTPKATTTSFPPTPPPDLPREEVHRPGLGPMIRKKPNAEVANKFRKAATAYNAFKPRTAGAVENTQEDRASGGDGITGVFQAPSLLKSKTQEDSRPSTPKQSLDERPSTPDVKKELPTINVTTAPAKPILPESPENLIQKPSVQKPVEVEKPPPVPVKAQEDRRKKRRSDHSAKYAKLLGINPSLIEGRTFEIEDILTDFGWGQESFEKTTFEELETGIKKELTRVEAGSWLSAVDNNDDRTNAVGEMMDRVTAECDELDCLLTLYNVELGTLSEDVAYIEAQSQGLQVQTANQKLLQSELQSLLDTISISADELRVLKDASLTKPDHIQKVEVTLRELYKAMLTIDPKLGRSGSKLAIGDQVSISQDSTTGNGGSDLSSMHAVREKRDGFLRESLEFIQRLKQYMNVKFHECEAKTLDAIEMIRDNNSTKLDHHLHDQPKRDLWTYSALLLFTREIDPVEWEDLLHMYEGCAKKPYQEEFRQNISAWKSITKRVAGDEQDILFTSQEKEPESLVGRKLTVKRSKTAKTDGSQRISSGDKPRDGKVSAYEAFAGALSEIARIMFVEQNFIVEMFHVSSLDNQDFVDATLRPLDQRDDIDLMVKKPFDPDRNMAKKATSAMEEIYSFWPSEMQELIDWAIKRDALNAVGVLFALETQLALIEETNQEFLTQAVAKLHDRLTTLFNRFINEQVRGIEDTKVKIKKRKGVIMFIKTFPLFSNAIENMLPLTPSLDQLPVRTLINDAYQKLNKTMFESLKFIAKESPTAPQTSTTTSGDPEDKEALNYHILLIENMNHYIEEVSTRNNPVLDDWILRARAQMSEHMDLYLSTVIRRPLGKLLDFLESTETALRNHSGPPSAIATRASHSRSTFKKILAGYDGREVRRGIETLKKRVEKHFGEGDEAVGGRRELVGKVGRECERVYLEVGERVGRVVREVYEGGLDVEWRREDVVTAFRK